MRPTILVVDDDKKLVELVKLYLERAGYLVKVATDGQEALDAATSFRPDLMVLDLMLPELDGLEVCRRVRESSDVPIVMLTAKSTEREKIEGLNLGADDYVTKPFSPGELLARIRAVLRRAGEKDGPELVSFGGLEIDFPQHRVTVSGREVDLTPTEFRLLAAMASEPGRVFSRARLIHVALGYDFGGFERTIDAHIKNLRRKIESDPRDPKYVVTVFGVGYRFALEEG